MKKALTFLSVALVALLLSSCVESSKKYQTLLAEKEALAVENQNMENEFNAAMGLINELENNLQAIRDEMGVLVVKKEGTDRDQVVSELVQIKEVMTENRQRLDSLNNALEKSNRNNANLRAYVKKLEAQLVEKEQMIADLMAQVSEKDGQINVLNTQVANLNKDLNNANNRIENLNNEKTAQVNALNTVYYVNGTAKELKAKGIILSPKKVLKNDVPTEEFTKGDMRDLNTIVFNTKKAVVLSTHSADSYNLVKGVDADGKKIVTLEITNPELFWKVTRYLVVLTK